MAIANAPERVSGRVEAVNPKGCKIDGQWWNWSKFADDLVPPERGQLVLLLLDKAGFVRTVAPLEGTESAAVPRVAGASDAPSLPVASVKDRTITRLAVLKAAAEFSASKPESKSSDVLKIAESWERWVLRDETEMAEQLG